MVYLQPLLFFLILSTMLGGFIGWLLRKLKNDKLFRALEAKVSSLRDTVTRQRAELSVNESKHEYINSLVTEKKAPLADAYFDSEYDRLKESEQDLRIKLSQLYAKKQKEINTLSSRLKNLQTRLNVINNESTIEVDSSESPEGEMGIHQRLEKAEAEALEFKLKLAELEQQKKGKTKHKKNVDKSFGSNGNDHVNNSYANDDLTRINGIGPKIKETLYSNGITSFEQIASLNTSDIRRIGKQLGSFGDRIFRDKWVSQAKKLV